MNKCIPFNLVGVFTALAASVLTGCGTGEVLLPQDSTTDPPGASNDSEETADNDFPDPETDEEGGFEQYWQEVLDTAWKYAERTNDEEALAALEMMDQLDQWTTPDFDQETIFVKQGAPEWVSEVVDQINGGIGQVSDSGSGDEASALMGTFRPALVYLSAIDIGATTDEGVEDILAGSRGWISCAPTSCYSTIYSSLSTAQNSLTNAGYHQVPGWAGGNAYDYAKATSYCRRWERVICQNYCTSAGCSNPPAGKYKTFGEGPEPDPELYTCAYAWVYGAYGFASWALYVWTYHYFC